MHQTSALTTRNLKIAFWLNSAFVFIELFGGLYTNSLAILSDAFHDFGDSISLGLAWYFQHLAMRGRDDRFTYGYRRFSLLGALVNALILIVGSVLITYFAWDRFNEPQETMSEGMAVLAVIGIVVNYIALKQLSKGRSLNERTIGLHLLADVLGWVAVLIGAIVIYFSNWYVIDAILSLLIAAYICYGAVKNMVESVNIILQRVPKDLDTDQIGRELRQIDGVSNLFDLHVWTLDGERTILSVHLVVNENVSRDQISRIRLQAREMLALHGIRHSTFEINLPDEVYIDEPDR